MTLIIAISGDLSMICARDLHAPVLKDSTESTISSLTSAACFYDVRLSHEKKCITASLLISGFAFVHDPCMACSCESVAWVMSCRSWASQDLVLKGHHIPPVSKEGKHMPVTEMLLFCC